jgi:hypothetical protein
MTEMPVKTPMPIGRTANFLPGIEESEAPATPAAEGETDVFDVEGDEIYESEQVEPKIQNRGLHLLN